MTSWSKETASMFLAFLDQLTGSVSKSCPDVLNVHNSAEKLFNIFKIYGKCEVSEFDAEVRTAKVFFHHHKGAKKARDKMQEFEIEGQKLAVDWSFVFGPKNTIDGEEKK